MNYNDVIMTCAFCRRKQKFGEMDQVCLRPLTEEEIEKFKEKKRKPLSLEFAMRCNKCKEKEVFITIEGYAIDTTPVEIISREKTIDMAAEREYGRYRASLFKKWRK